MSERTELQQLLEECPQCGVSFNENIALIADDDTRQLTEEQIKAVLASMQQSHRQHVH